MLKSEFMENLSKASIKKIIKEGSNPDIIISDEAAEAIAKLLEEKAKQIAAYAVERAKRKQRETITEEDIEAYMVVSGD